MSVRRGLKLTENQVRLVESAALEHAKYADDPAVKGAWKIIARQSAALLKYFARKRAEAAALHPEQHDLPPREGT